MPKAQTANTIILEMPSAKKDDIEDLKRGEGKLFKKLAKTIDELKDSGQVEENAQPIVVIVPKKSDNKF
ncbi:hypothetical protein [Roseofilum capinflatum]|uniref:Uncharacterized protein n=1 Tax=Roseofilum capinflatum BLCC-M114 TaxID=3022440 RepID=A0ABT7B8P6_9CYAN|nr:hypothetical protein [Roseofilum capinflatum]MDJ1175539.1 hypothetical protein [Roseofilum capinflatum BLCC-M114]